MKSIYLVSYSPFSGKTAVALGLALCLKEKGINVGYFKPISVGIEVKPGRFIDHDVTLIKNVLKLQKPMAEIAPPIKERIGTYQFGKKYLENPESFKAPIINAFKQIQDSYDFLIIEGRHRIQSLFTYKLDAITLSKELDSKILIVSQGVIDNIILQKTLIEGMKATLLGTIFNNIGLPLIQKIRGELLPLLDRYGINFYGAIPEDIQLTSPSVAEYYQALGGQLLVGEEYTDKLIESVHIGAMRTESALKFLKRSRNYALITGGDRADLIYRAFETDLSLLILTGNLYPDVKVLIKAEEKKIPVLLVNHETSVTYDICSTITARINPRQTKKIELIKDLVKNNLKWQEIYEDA
ncbi:MAG: DRTGG domain-containing protein [Candidatus Helarchaeota archaeon]